MSDLKFYKDIIANAVNDYEPFWHTYFYNANLGNNPNMHFNFFHSIKSTMMHIWFQNVLIYGLMK